MKYSLLALFLVSGFLSCQNADVAKRKEKSRDNVYYDYQIWGEEDSPEATIKLQYKTEDEEGQGMALEAPANVYLDKTPFHLDSSKFSGSYYELTKPISELEGEHAIVFVDKEGKERKETFSFQPFALAAELPETLSRKPFVLALKNFSNTDAAVRLVLTDTSLESAGVNEEVDVVNGKITVDSAMLSHLTSGPVTLELTREEKQPLKNGHGAGGRLLMTYGLRRQFQLAD